MMIQKGGDEMTKHPKSRQISRPATVILSPGGNRTGDRVRKILADNNLLSTEDWFILTQVQLICLFRRVRNDSRGAKLSKYISRREEKYIGQKKEKESPETNLTTQDFIDLNRWVVSQDLAGKLENLIKRVKERKKQAKREAKRAEKK